MHYLAKTVGAAAVALTCTGLLGGCDNDADVVSQNLSTAADSFQVARRFIFINGITDKYLLVVEGYCSLGNNDTSRRMSVTCKTGPREYKKHILGLSDNVTFVAEQIDAKNVSPNFYRVVFKPETVIPSIDVR